MSEQAKVAGPSRPRLQRTNHTDEYVAQSTERRKSDAGPRMSDSYESQAARFRLQMSPMGPSWRPQIPTPLAGMLPPGPQSPQSILTPQLETTAIELTSMSSSYFPPLVRIASEPDRRRSSVAAFFHQRRETLSKWVTTWNQTFNPPDNQLVEPFSFVSTKTSLASAAKLAIGLLGQAGYTFGSILLVNSLYQVPNPPGLAPGVGSSRPMTPDGQLAYKPPSVAIGATVFSVGIVLGLTSSMLFLADGLRIAGNRKKAYTYVSMHLSGILLICLSKFIITWRKNHTPLQHIIALSVPAGIGRGLHAVTIPRSFSNSEIVNGDFARLTFEQRQIASEALRITSFIFFGLWAASWSVANFDPLEREGWGILASLTLNLSAALPNTNLRRADIFRRSQQSAVNSQLNSYVLGSPPMTPNVSSQGHIRPSSPTPLIRQVLQRPPPPRHTMSDPLAAAPVARKGGEASPKEQA